MEKLTEEGAQVRAVNVAELRTHPALQARDPAQLKERERVRQEEQSKLHIRDMALLLKADPAAELVPLHVADVEGALYVVDGHHRLAAYRRANRETAPAQVRRMSLEKASHQSKLANIGHTKIEMRPEQKRNALWHHLSALTWKGSRGLPSRFSQRSLSGTFGVSLDTVQRMLKRLPEVVPEEYPAEHRDAITGWPHWRFVKRSARAEMYQAMAPEARVRWQADKYKRKLAKLWEQYPAEALQVAHAELRAEAAEGPDEDDRALRKELEEAYEAVWEERGVRF